LLAAAVELAGSTKERSAIVAQFWTRRPTLFARLAAVRQATEQTTNETVELLLEHLTRDLTLEQLDVARSVLWAKNGGAPLPLLRRLCKLLHEAVARDGQPSGTAEVTEAIRLADVLLKSKRAKKTAPKKRATKTSQNKPRRKSGTNETSAASGEPKQRDLGPQRADVAEQLTLRLGRENLSDG
jgi:hypothetical protein